MKILTALLLLSAFALGFIALRSPEPQAAPPMPVRSDAVPYELAGDVPEGHVVRAFAVEGMCCDGCAKKLHTAIMGVDGVQQAAVDSVLGRALVIVPDTLEVARLEQALTFEDYVATLEP